MRTAESATALCGQKWPAKKIKHFLKRVYGGGTPDKEEPRYWVDGTIPWVSPKDMKKSFLNDAEDYITEAALEETAASLVEPGSLLVVVRSGILQHSIPVAITTGPVSLNQDMKALVPGPDLDPIYLKYWIEGQQTELLNIWRHYGATVESIDLHRMLNTWIAVPDLETQREICRFLDVEVHRIDSLISHKEKLVSILLEKRRADEAILTTRGLLEKPILTETGLLSSPLAPSHWRVRRIATIFRESLEMGEEGLPVLSVSINTGISDKQLEDEDRHRLVNQIEDKTAYKRVRPGDLVYNMMRAWQGAFGVAKVDGLVSPAYVVSRPMEDIHAPYFESLLRTSMWVEDFRRASRGIADFRQRLYWENFRQIGVLLPPHDEQVAIAAEIQRRAANIDGLLSPIRTSIERLYEFRYAMITAAVNGKIDPQHWKRQGILKGSLERLEARTAAEASA